VQSLSSASSFINQDSALRLIILGALTLLAATLFNLARRERRRDVYGARSDAFCCHIFHLVYKEIPSINRSVEVKKDVSTLPGFTLDNLSKNWLFEYDEDTEGYTQGLRELRWE